MIIILTLYGGIFDKFDICICVYIDMCVYTYICITRIPCILCEIWNEKIPMDETKVIEAVNIEGNVRNFFYEKIRIFYLYIHINKKFL